MDGQTVETMLGYIAVIDRVRLLVPCCSGRVGLGAKSRSNEPNLRDSLTLTELCH